jgi:hypothetical protein
MATRPHAKVKNGSHTEGVTRFRTRFEGISLAGVGSVAIQWGLVLALHEPHNVRRVEHGEPLIILMVDHADILLQVIEPSVADICSIKEGAEKQDGKYWQDSALLSALGLASTSRWEDSLTWYRVSRELGASVPCHHPQM